MHGRGKGFTLGEEERLESSDVKINYQSPTRRIAGFLTYLGFFSLLNLVRADTPPTIGVQLYAGITITGTVGTVYSVQYATNLTAASPWITLTNLNLTHSPFLWIDTTQPAVTRRFYRVTVATPPNFVWIPPGTFTMGSPSNEVDRAADEGPQTVVTLTHGFYLSKYLVTQAEYLAVMGNNPSTFPGQSSRPVETVSWFDATNYCGRRTQQELAAGLIPDGSFYRLPTEAEWEYACRSGTTTRFYYGNDPGYGNLTNYAWYNANSGNTTHVVGQKLANPSNLFDMAGNVLEWCQDWYAPGYLGDTVTDPTGPATGTARVLRGGDWFSFAWFCRSASRNFAAPSSALSVTGVRVVLDHR